jgi:hypothetical protein
MKLTKRKGFNFFRSYFDVYNELETDADKVAFMDALFERQFLGIKPTELKGMAKFAYISQTNSIDSQVKGYEDKTRSKLNPLEVNNYTPTQPPTVGVNEKEITPSLQVEEEVQEKEKVQSVCIEKDKQITVEHFLKRWADARLAIDGNPTFIKKLINSEIVNFNELARDYTILEFEHAIDGLFRQKTYPSTRVRPKHFLNREHFETYLTCFTTKEKLFDNNKYKKVDRL